MAENKKSEIVSRLEAVSNLSEMLSIVGVDSAESFAENYPDVARQVAYGARCSESLTAKGIVKGQLFIKTRKDGNGIAVSFDSYHKIPDVDSDQKIYCFGQEIYDSKKGTVAARTELLTREHWTGHDGKPVSYLANANAGRFLPVNGQDMLVGFAPNGELVGDTREFVHNYLFDADGNVRDRCRVYGRELTAEQCKKIEKGEAVAITGLKNKEGELFDVVVQYAPGHPDNKLQFVHPTWYMEAKRRGMVAGAAVKQEEKPVEKKEEKAAVKKTAVKKVAAKTEKPAEKKTTGKKISKSI